jgi:hypothetical protein
LPAPNPVATTLLPVATRVVVVDGMKRLVHVADEMQKELQREKPLSRSRCRIAKLGCELLDLVNKASFRRAA